MKELTTCVTRTNIACKGGKISYLKRPPFQVQRFPHGYILDFSPLRTDLNEVFHAIGQGQPAEVSVH